MNSLPRILIVEDELPMRTVLQDCLESEGYRVIAASDGISGLEKAIHEKPGLILLDVMMPNLDGFSVCREVRRLGCRAPILMLTAKGMVRDRVTGLDAGADDYLVKPFSTEELLARVRALWRRAARPESQPGMLKLGRIEIDLARLTASAGGQPLHLSAREYGMLRLMADADGGPVSRERFLDIVWGYGAFPTTRTVDTHIASLRAKIEPDPAVPTWIKTVHAIGYRLEWEK